MLQAVVLQQGDREHHLREDIILLEKNEGKPKALACVGCLSGH